MMNMLALLFFGTQWAYHVNLTEMVKMQKQKNNKNEIQSNASDSLRLEYLCAEAFS